uniref:Uncharacterized protein n=1 Tax=Opuntia streptacantha TaxID=393608 RepID=A0A7C8Z457_OPUST
MNLQVFEAPTFCCETLQEGSQEDLSIIILLFRHCHSHRMAACLLKCLAERASCSFGGLSHQALLTSGLDPQMRMMNPDNAAFQREHRRVLERGCMQRYPLGDQTCSLDRICICHTESKICTMVLPDAMASPEGSRGSLELE